MPRPKKCRLVNEYPHIAYFKPRGIPLRHLKEVVLSVDEYEALRLADLDGMNQEEASRIMNVSRQTFGRILEKARRTIADALVNGKAICIEGGEFKMTKGEVP